MGKIDALYEKSAAEQLLEEAQASKNLTIKLWANTLIEENGEEGALKKVEWLMLDWEIDNLDDLIYVITQNTEDNRRRIRDLKVENTIVYKRADKEAA